MNQEKKLPSSGGITAKLNHHANKTGIPFARLQKMIAVIIVSQLVPEGTVIKGGNALGLRFPLEDSRMSNDLDLVFGDSYVEWESEFRARLAKGINGFDGSLEDRGKRETQTIERDPGRPNVIYKNIKLRYLGKSFSTLPLDITPAQGYERSSSSYRISDDSITLLKYLGFEEPTGARLLDVEAQLAQKTAALYSSKDPRPSDLTDMVRLFPVLDGEGNLELYRSLLALEMEIREIKQPYDIPNKSTLQQLFRYQEGGDDGTSTRITKRVEKEMNEASRRTPWKPEVNTVSIPHSEE